MCLYVVFKWNTFATLLPNLIFWNIFRNKSLWNIIQHNYFIVLKAVVFNILFILYNFYNNFVFTIIFFNSSLRAFLSVKKKIVYTEILSQCTLQFWSGPISADECPKKSCIVQYIGVKLLVEALFEGLTSPTYRGSSAKEARLLLTQYEARVR